MNDENEITSLYPPVPPYMRFFTQENLDKLQDHKQKRCNEHINITTKLSFLIPPPFPESGQYRAFGNIWHVKDKLPDLESMGQTQLYQEASAKNPINYQLKIKELHKLLKSMLINMLDLTGILSINPELFPDKMKEIKSILINIHHLLNEYRPHQSRESLIMLLEEQLEHKKREIKHIEQVCAEVKQDLKNMCKDYIE